MIWVNPKFAPAILPMPGRAILAIFNGYPEPIKPVTDQVRDGPVFLFAHFGADFNQQADKLVRIASDGFLFI